MEVSEAPPGFVQDLEAKLVAAGERLESRRRLARRGAIVLGILAVLLVFGGTVPFTGQGGGLQPALAIESEAETVRIRLLGAAADPEAVQQELAAVGIAAEVDAVPASPSLQGTWVSAELDGSGNVEVSGGTLVARRPVSSLVLIYGRAPAADEDYQIATSAFAPGEALHCVELLGRRAEEAAAILRDKGLTITWRQQLPADASGNAHTLPVEEPPHGVVVDVSPLAPGQVYAFVTDPAIADQFLGPTDPYRCP